MDNKYNDVHIQNRRILKEIKELNNMKNTNYMSFLDVNSPEGMMLIKWIEICRRVHIILTKFPRHEKFMLSQEIRRKIYTVVDLYIDIKFKQFKKTYVEKIRHEIEKIRVDFIVAQQLGYFYIKTKKGIETTFIDKYGRLNLYGDIMERLTNILNILIKYETDCKRINKW